MNDSKRVWRPIYPTENLRILDSPSESRADDSVSPPAMHSTLPGFIDINTDDPLVLKAPRRHSWLVSAIAVIAIIACTITGGLSGSPFGAVVVFLVFLIGTLSTFGYLQNEANRRWRELVERSQEAPAQQLIIKSLHPVWLGLDYRMRTIVRVFTANGRSGLTFRFCPLKLREDVRPIEHSFEPLPLDEVSITFVGLESDSRDVAEADSVKLDASRWSDSSVARKRLRRNVILGGGWGIVIVFGINLAIAVVEAIANRKISSSVVLWTIWFLLIFLGVNSRGATRGNRQWLLVPGGIVSRRAKSFQGRWDLHFYKRANSVMALHGRSRHIWHAHVADSTGYQFARLTAREAHMLLRGWLSPIESPSRDHLSDLG